MAATPGPTPPVQIQDLKPAAPDYGEPWVAGTALLSQRSTVYSHGMTLAAFDATGRPVEFDQKTAARAVGCVNLLAGVPDDVLSGPRTAAEDLALAVLRSRAAPGSAVVASLIDEAQAEFGDHVFDDGLTVLAWMKRVLKGIAYAGVGDSAPDGSSVIRIPYTLMGWREFRRRVALLDPPRPDDVEEKTTGQPLPGSGKNDATAVDTPGAPG